MSAVMISTKIKEAFYGLRDFKCLVGKKGILHFIQQVPPLMFDISWLNTVIDRKIDKDRLHFHLARLGKFAFYKDYFLQSKIHDPGNGCILETPLIIGQPS